ncbi:MAG: RNA methyltransferase [bacterium]|nr:RNA methyltransferase [bacterium]
MITVVLVEPESPGNIGAVCRAMKNFGLTSLVLVNPKCKHMAGEAKGRAMHALNILKKAKVAKIDCLDKFDYVIGTTSIIGSDYNIPRCPIKPEELAAKNLKGKIALLIGRESSGLTNEEILKCDFIVSIPVSKTYPALNMSHAAAIIFYELFKKKNTKSAIAPISKKEKEIIFQKVDKILENMSFTTEQKKETQRRVWKRMIGKAMLTKREAFALLGFLRKLK